MDVNSRPFAVYFVTLVPSFPRRTVGMRYKALQRFSVRPDFLEGFGVLLDKFGHVFGEIGQ
jgi:hypothetical protein